MMIGEIALGDVVRRSDLCTTYRWDVAWGRTRREVLEGYRAEGKLVRRKNGQPDMRYKGNRLERRLAEEDAGLSPRGIMA